MLEQYFTGTVSQAIVVRSPVTFLIVYAAGILTSLSPCILSMVPVMVGYIGGYGQPDKTRGFVVSSAFVLGLAVTFSILGISAALLGRIFGQIGKGWYVIVALVAIVMGLQLFGLIHFNFPGLQQMPVKAKGMIGAFLVGLFFGLVASPCATPVLAVIMAYVASQGDLVYGAGLLFVYGLGHGFPLLLVGTFTAAFKGLNIVRKYSQYVNYACGSILIGLGIYFLTRVL